MKSRITGTVNRLPHVADGFLGALGVLGERRLLRTHTIAEEPKAMILFALFAFFADTTALTAPSP